MYSINEYLSQSYDCADLVSLEDRLRFVDDLSILEIVNLLTVEITSYNIKEHIRSDLNIHNQYIIPPENLKSQDWLNKIDEWTMKQKMLMNEKKTKNMIFYFFINISI